MNRMMRCKVCGAYTFKDTCCGRTVSPHPPKFSPDDKYGKYRRQVKEEEYRKGGLA